MSNNSQPSSQSYRISEDSEREQLGRWRRLTLLEKLTAVEEMAELGTHLLHQRQKRGLPYIDPDTRKLIRSFYHLPKEQ